MIDVFLIFLALMLGYLLGSINTSLIVGKLYGKDIRNFGSNNAGASNAYNVLGKFAAVIVLIGDVLKGVIACIVGLMMGVYLYWNGTPECVSLLAAGIGAILGHNWPIYFGFKGGKGALTGVTVLFMTNWVMALICLIAFLIIIVVTRYYSVSAMCAATLFPIFAFTDTFGSSTLYFHIFSILTPLIVILSHIENIKRLISGTEKRLTF